jgi:metallophosphoesterase superfamily enzyme
MPASITQRLGVDELEKLKQFCMNEGQLRKVEAVLEHGSNRQAAKALGIAPSSVDNTLQSIRKRAAQLGYSPDHDMTRTVPDGFSVSGVSTMYDQDGNVRAQWVKSKAERELLMKLTMESAIAVFSEHDMKVPVISKPKKSMKDYLTVYPMGDPHMGMYAWAEETGTDFDLDIAERNLVTAVERLVDAAPPSEKALIVNVGDFFHSDNQSNRTSRSGHALDVDSRWAKVLRVGIRAMRQCIEAALRKHQQVHVINEIGNHDDHTAQVLTLALSMAYEKNKRVTFDHGPGRFHYYRFHDVFIGVTHGDTVKPDKLGGIMATDNPKDWGDTTRRYWYTGHIHTRNVFEVAGCEVESFRTLAGKDAWTAAMGYRSGRDMYCIVHHKNYGEVERHRKDILMLED